MAGVTFQLPNLLSSSLEKTSTSSDVVRIDFMHELGVDGTSLPQQRTVVIPPSSLATTVLARSSVISQSASTLQSPAYIASVRRRAVSSVIRQISALADCDQREDFAVFTYPISEAFYKLLNKTLVDADEEGNTREILRRVRDTFLDCGLEAYRDGATRAVVIGVLKELIKTEEVTPLTVERTLTALRSHGLKSIGIGLLGIVDVESETEEEEVLS